MHVWQTDGQGHGARKSVPDHLDLDDVQIATSETVGYDYPDSQNLGTELRLDTYTGGVYEGKRGVMVHLGQKAGQDNIPEDVTEHHDADDFPVVDVDEDGNITKLIKEGNGVPSANPWLPDHIAESEPVVRVSRIEEFVETIRRGPGAADADTIEEELLKHATK